MKKRGNRTDFLVVRTAFQKYTSVRLSCFLCQCLLDVAENCEQNNFCFRKRTEQISLILSLCAWVEFPVLISLRPHYVMQLCHPRGKTA